MPSFVVGIGASAGGLEALEAFFDAMPTATDMAFVVVQHLSPDFKSLMSELLGRHTEMAIHRAEDDLPLRPNAIYLIPPRKEMIISDGRLLLTDSDPEKSLNLPIDVFFRALAQDYGNRAIGVVLSGTGSDGSRGIRDIHKGGGLVIAQDSQSAKFDGMPRASQATGHVDFVLPPEKMSDVILDYVKQRPGRGDDAADTAAGDEDQRYGKIFRLLRQGYGIDFTSYKASTVSRRVERRIFLNRHNSVDDYADLLANDEAELDALYRDLLIGVTRFFRDAEAFDRLQDVITPLLAEKAQSPEGIRVWVPGCATGEEAYSIAILLREAADRLGVDPTIKVFATDVHRDSLEIASAGLFTRDNVAGVSPQRLERHFSRVGAQCQISGDLRRLVVFAKQDVLRDPPFTKVDLISCRNLLIYFESQAQEKALSIFHFALNRNGLLLLGPSESLGRLDDEFDVIDTRWHLYRKRRDIRITSGLSFEIPSERTRTWPPNQVGPTYAGRRLERKLAQVYDFLLDRYVPSSMLINERAELAYTFGKAGRYLHTKKGRSSLNVFDMVTDELRLALHAALPRSQKEQAPVVFRSVKLVQDDHDFYVNLTVEPVPHDERHEQFFLVTIEEDKTAHSAPPAAEDFNLKQEARQRISSLEHELHHTRETLQATVEELETSNEELQATNEELMASNEELQSTNEELHSVNEELYTVNAEHQRKIVELQQVTDDLDNLLHSLEIGVIFLDEGLRVRKFTDTAGESFNLLPQDLGRPIDHVTHRLEDVDLEASVLHVLKTGETVSLNAHRQDGEWLLIRCLPYRSKARERKGVVITLTPITALREADTKLHIQASELDRANRDLAEFFDMSVDLLAIVDRDGHFTRVSQSWTRELGWQPNEVVGRPMQEFLHPDDVDRTLESIVRADAATLVREGFVNRYRAKDGRYVALQWNTHRDDKTGSLFRVARVMPDEAPAG